MNILARCWIPAISLMQYFQYRKQPCKSLYITQIANQRNILLNELLGGLHTFNWNSLSLPSGTVYPPSLYNGFMSKKYPVSGFLTLQSLVTVSFLFSSSICDAALVFQTMRYSHPPLCIPTTKGSPRS